MTRQTQGSESSLTDNELDQLILSEYPLPIAVNYQRLLDMVPWIQRTDRVLELFEWGLRTVTLTILSQYLTRDIHEVNHEKLNYQLLKHLPQASLGKWVELLFLSLEVYEGKQDLFFTQELYQLYWDTSTTPHRKHRGIKKIRGPFDRLVQIRNDLVHRRSLPETEADWEAIGREAQDLLRSILKQFSFIRDYYLIRVVRQLTDQHYEYEQYKGQSIVQQVGRLIHEVGNYQKEVQEGWFYLLRWDRQVLELHPLLVLWTSDGDQVLEEGEKQDVALYDRLVSETTAEFVALVVRERIEDKATLLREVRELIFYNLGRLKMGVKTQKQLLTWETLNKASQELSERNMGGMLEKYDEEIYLQREETIKHFKKFLKSDKVCFVLTGKSGVGKSNFVLSLRDIEKQQHAEKDGPSEAENWFSENSFGYLMYDGAGLDVPDSVTATINEDLTREVNLDKKQIPQDIFAPLEVQGEMNGKRFLLVFDAINENTDGKSLLRKIDELVKDTKYPWLKVLITSRPQAWRSLKRGLRLTETRYYRAEDSDELSVEMVGFKLDDFKRDELEDVYKNYQQSPEYKLKTDFKDIPFSVREALRDPLVLRLVAEVYKDEKLPHQIRVSDIYRIYIEAMLQRDSLRQKDLRFLEQEVLPLMLAEGRYDNRVTSEEVNRVRPTDGRPLWELIHSEDLLSNKEKVNASFQRLVDAEILIRQGSQLNYEIRFKYERFYDYFGGRHLLELVDQGKGLERLIAYQEWILTTREYAFLWGPVENALRDELKRGRETLIIDLCQTDEQIAKEMMVAVLIDFGLEELEKTNALLNKLMQMGQDEMPFWQKHFLTWQSLEPARGVVNARKAAIEVAEKLGNVAVLEKGCLDRSTEVRTHAIRHTANLWENEKKESGSTVVDNRGFEVLRRVAGKTRAGRVPNVQAAEAVISILLYMALASYDNLRLGNDDLLKRELHQLTRQTMNKLLYISEQRGLSSVIRNGIREWVISILAKWVIRVVEDTPERMTFNPRNIEPFLKRPRSEKEYMRVITRYIDSRNTDIEMLEENLSTVFVLDEGSTDYALQFALIAQWDENKESVLRMAEYLFKEGIKAPVPHYTPYVSTNVLGAVLLRGKGDESILRQYFEWLDQLVEKAKGRVIFSGNEYLRSEFGAYFEAGIQGLDQSVNIEKPRQLAEMAVRERDGEFIKAIIYELSGSIGRKEFHRAVFDVLEPLLPLLNTESSTPEDKEIAERLVNLLARFRSVAQDDVDDFMVEKELSDHLQRRVKTVEIKGAVGGDFLYGPGAKFIVDGITYSQELQQVAIWILNCTIICSTFEKYANLFIRRLANLVYGEDIFDLSKYDVG